MKRILLLACLLLATSSAMAQKRMIRIPQPVDFRPALLQGIKISALPSASSATADDLLVMVDSPSGSAVTKKISVANFFASIPASTITNSMLAGGIAQSKVTNLTTDLAAKLTVANNLSDLANAATARSNLGLGTLATQNGTFSGTSSGTNTGDQVISDATITLTDITTNNVSTTKHGFAPKGDGDTSKFLNANGAYSIPAGGGSVTPTSTDAFENKTINAEATGNVITLSEKKWFPAAFCDGTSPASGFDLPVTLAPTPACKTGSNTQKGVLEFPDIDGDYSAQGSHLLPDDWSGTMDAKIRWLAAATSGDAVFQLQTSCVADAETDDPGWNTADVFTADTAKATTLQSNDVTRTGITITGCAAGELLHFRVIRNRTHASDTITGVIQFLGLELTLRRAQ